MKIEVKSSRGTKGIKRERVGEWGGGVIYLIYNCICNNTFRKLTLGILCIMCLTQGVRLLTKFTFLVNLRADAGYY